MKPLGVYLLDLVKQGETVIFRSGITKQIRILFINSLRSEVLPKSYRKVYCYKY